MMFSKKGLRDVLVCVMFLACEVLVFGARAGLCLRADLCRQGEVGWLGHGILDFSDQCSKVRCVRVAVQRVLPSPVFVGVEDGRVIIKCRSVPQIALAVSRTIASVGCSITGSGISSRRISLMPCQTIAFIV